MVRVCSQYCRQDDNSSRTQRAQAKQRLGITGQSPVRFASHGLLYIIDRVSVFFSLLYCGVRPERSLPARSIPEGGKSAVRDVERIDSMGQIQDARLIQSAPVSTSSWRRVLLTGILFYIATLGALILTRNPILFPTV